MSKKKTQRLKKVTLHPVVNELKKARTLLNRHKKKAALADKAQLDLKIAEVDKLLSLTKDGCTAMGAFGG